MIESTRKKILGFYALGLAVLWLFYLTLGTTESSIIVLLASVLNILVFGILLYKELKYCSDFHPFMLLLIAGIQYVGFNGVSLYQTVMEGERVTFGVYNITNDLAKGALFLSLEHLLLYMGFAKVQSKYERILEPTIHQRLMQSNVNFFKVAIEFYGFVWLLRVLENFVNLQAINSVLYNVTNQGQMVTLFFLLVAYLKTGYRKYMQIHWIILAVEVVMVLSSGMKEVMMQNFIPYVIYLFLQVKSGSRSLNTSFIVKMGAIGAFVVFFAFPYVSLYREINWYKGRNASVSEVLSEYVEYMTTDKPSTKKNRDVDYMMKRTGSLGSNTFSIMYADKYGIQPIYMATAFSAIIPRFLWPNKPTIRIGLMVQQMANGKSNWQYTKGRGGASFTPGFIGSCYMSLGLLYALIMPFMMGIFVTNFWYYFKKRIAENVIAIWAIFTIVATAYKDFENFYDGGVIFCAFALVYCLIIKYMERNGYSKRVS